MSCVVYIATSLDGYIADAFGSTSFLSIVSNPEQEDIGFEDFVNSMDCLVIGRKTYETILGFKIEWPYNLPVYVMSNTLKSVYEGLDDNVTIVNGNIEDVVLDLNCSGFKNVWIDGGEIIQQAIEKELVDQLTITTIPIILGSGVPLFVEIETEQVFELIDSKVLINQMVSTTYKKVKS
ncbi:MAG: dihydrofolate reductase [Spirochaetaceae bacterium]|nr:dihydrofolate reductase [Spirochaetaceae bacterium]